MEINNNNNKRDKNNINSKTLTSAIKRDRIKSLLNPDQSSLYFFGKKYKIC